eukprot:gene6686-8002_t
MVAGGLGECDKRSKFYTFFDVNLSNKRAWDLINYMKDGLFIDANTNQVSVQLITYNSQLRYFGNVDLTFNFDKSRGGLIHVKRSVQTIKIELYETSNDILRACFEVLFAAMIISSAFIECREIWDIVAREKSARTYFKSLWNYIDITSIILSAMIAASWVFFVVTQAQRFSMEPRYEVYAKLESYGRWLKLNGQGEDFQELLDRFQEMSDMTRFQGFSDIAKSSNTLFNMMVFGDNSVVEELVGLSEPSMNAIASIFYMSYALLVVMVLLNFLLAIVMDSFAIVKEASKEATAIGEELCYYGKASISRWWTYMGVDSSQHLAYIDQRRNQAMPDQTALNYLQSLREGQQRALKELDLDKAWEETILVRGKAIESLSGAQVKQALLEAAAAADNPRIEAGGAQKEDDVVRVFDIDAEEAEEKQNAVAVARKVMEKFGLREDVDDADEEKMQQKQQTQQIFDMLQMLTLQASKDHKH